MRGPPRSCGSSTSRYEGEGGIEFWLEERCCDCAWARDVGMSHVHWTATARVAHLTRNERNNAPSQTSKLHRWTWTATPGPWMPAATRSPSEGRWRSLLEARLATEAGMPMCVCTNSRAHTGTCISSAGCDHCSLKRDRGLQQMMIGRVCSQPSLLGCCHTRQQAGAARLDERSEH